VDQASPTWGLKSRSHRIRSTTQIVQSIVTSSCSLRARPKRVHLRAGAGRIRNGWTPPDRRLSVGQDCETLRNYLFDEPRVVRAELPDECPHTQSQRTKSPVTKLGLAARVRVAQYTAGLTRTNQRQRSSTLHPHHGAPIDLACSYCQLDSAGPAPSRPCPILTFRFVHGCFLLLN